MLKIVVSGSSPVSPSPQSQTVPEDELLTRVLPDPSLTERLALMEVGTARRRFVAPTSRLLASSLTTSADPPLSARDARAVSDGPNDRLEV